METYTPKIIAFVVDLSSSKNASLMKSELIEFFKEVEGDDKLYYQNHTGLVFEKRSQIVPAIASYKVEPKQLLHLKIRDAISALNCEIGDYTKHIFIVTDKFLEEDYQLQKVMDICDKLDFEVVIFKNLSDLRKEVYNHYREVANEN